MAEHTPGPWSALRCEHGWHIGPQPAGVCSISDNSGGERRDQQEANARLIAAAPEMLEALRAIIYASDKCQGHRNCDHNMTGWTLGRAVLAKVEG